MKDNIPRIIGILTCLLIMISIVTAWTTASGKSKDLKIRRYPGNYNAFKLQTSDGTTIITDPYNMKEDANTDIVIESHQHDDHTDVSRIKGTYKLIRDPGVFKLKSVVITGIKGAHDKVNPFYAPEPNNIYIIEADGIKLVQFGSQGQVPTSEMYKKIGKADVLFIQVFSDSQFKMNLEEIMDVIRHVKPKAIIPEHGDISAVVELSKAYRIPMDSVESGKLTLNKSIIHSIKKPKIILLDNP